MDFRIQLISKPRYEESKWMIFKEPFKKIVQTN